MLYRYPWNLVSLAFCVAIIFISAPDAFARWEIGAKAGYDSNINRALDGEQSDSYLTGFLSFVREPNENLNLDWTLNLSLEGTAHAQTDDLNYGMATLAPGLVFYPHPKWAVGLNPFVQVKGVSDTEQSSVAFGGKLSMKQPWNGKFYTGQYFLYTDSQADEEVYSYQEKAVGVYAGINWTKAFWSEIGYEFSHMDSFRSIGAVQTTTVGRGRQRRYSKTFNEYIISEPVDRHTIGLNAGYQFTPHLYAFVNFAYAAYQGDSGDSDAQAASIGLGYKF